MQCPACQTPNPDSHRFCESCGASLALKCASCGFDCSPGARFCGGCGKALQPGQAGGLPAAYSGNYTAPAPSRPPVAMAPTVGWGELKQATVLFADIVSSTEQIARLDPEEAMERLKPAVMQMCEAVERFGGTVMRTLGDGVMALFGVPKALEGHATLACEAALHMQSVFASNPHGVSIRVGLHSGLVASDPHAPDGGKGGGAHGMTIHLASRVVGVAQPGGVALTGDCHSLIRGSVEVESMGLKQLKGVPEEVEIFNLVALKPQYASHHFHQARLTPLRGREKELTTLQLAQRLTDAGDAQVIGLTGGPGAGKSRLCYEFAQWCRARSIPVYEVRAQLYGSATPLQPVLELMRTFFFSIGSMDTPEQARHKIALRLEAAGMTSPADAELFNEFLGVSESTDAVSSLNAKARRGKLLAAVRELMRHDAATPSVVLIEDLHWLDEASEEFVAALVDAAAGTRTMLVLNYRSSYRSPWAQRQNFRELELAELSAADTGALVRELISHRREFQEIAELIVKRSGGNPFFAEELVRSLAERGVLSGDPDNPANGLRSVESALPATVQAVIGARIDRLTESEKSLLQMCAIVGKEVPLAILERVAAPYRLDVERGLDSLVHAELVQPQPAVGGRRYAFRHPLIQEVAYGSQLKAKRSAIHATVAEAMEHYYAEQLDEFAGLIAHHYEAAGQGMQAATYAVRAARWLGGRNSANAIKFWEKARSLLAAQPRSAEADSLRALACSQICLLGWREGLNLAAVQPYIDEAMELADRVDPRMVQLLLIIEGRMLQASGGPADWYVHRVIAALKTAEAAEDIGRIATLNAALCQAYGWAGLLEKALEANDMVLRHAHAIDAYDHAFMGFNVKHWAMGMRGRLLTRMGRLQEAHQHLEDFIGSQEVIADPVLAQIAHYSYVDLAQAERDASLAEKHSIMVREMADRFGSPYMRVFAGSSKGIAHAIAQEHEAAATTFAEVLETIRNSSVSLEWESEVLASLAEANRELGRNEDALQFARQAIEVAQERSTRLAECRAQIILAALLLDTADPAQLESAQQALDAAAALLEETGARSIEPGLNEQKSRMARARSLLAVSGARAA